MEAEDLAASGGHGMGSGAGRLVDWPGAIERRTELTAALRTAERGGVRGAGRFADALRAELATLPHPRWLDSRRTGGGR